MFIGGIFLFVGFLFGGGMVLGTAYKKVAALKEDYPKKTFVVYRALFRWQRLSRFFCYAMLAATVVCIMVGIGELYMYDEPANISGFLNTCFGFTMFGGFIMAVPLSFSLPNDMLILTPNAVWLHKQGEEYLSFRGIMKRM